MIEHTYQVLGFYRLLDILSQYASCPVGQSDCLSLKPSNDVKLIGNELNLVAEMRLLLKVKGFLSFSGLTDISPLLRKSGAEGSCLEPEELLDILGLSRACGEAVRQLRSNRELCPGMCELVRDMPGLGELVKALSAAVAPNGEIKDSASSSLRRIRAQKTRLRTDLQKALEGIHESAGLLDHGKDHVVTVRKGRYVIALRTDQKSRIEGIVHDYSQTRATCFFEPVAVINDNNRMSELAQEERAEVFRILSGLTQEVRDLAGELECARTLVGRIDGIRARARLDESLTCVRPEICEEGGIELRGARNPILAAMALDPSKEGRAPVPVDILLDEARNPLIISGPNRGGKTVSLKTLGLVTLMAQSGMHVPAEEGSRVPVFHRILADIGDDQDIQEGLSTFSAHAAHMRYLAEHAGPESLVIIDEPGLGTDPNEGVALAMAILDFLCARGALVAVSTHYSRLKTYGLLNRGAINASVEFDNNEKRPTFRLIYGSPGVSHGLEIARDVGVPSSILDQARGYLDRNEVDLNRRIEQLNRLMGEAGEENEKALKARARYEEASREIGARIEGMEREKRAFMDEKRAEAAAVINEAREELRRAINLMKEKGLAQAAATEKYAQVSRRVMERLEPETKKPGGLKTGVIAVGQPVFHRKLKQKGLVHELDAAGERATVMLGRVKVSALVNDLEILEGDEGAPSEEPQVPVSWHLRDSLPRELNVIGYRVDEAIPLIDRTIDRALVEGEANLRIVHGFGTGKLKRAIREHLKEVPFVKKICSADARFGGDAITIVEL
jgi:DNA mismatch repair protein MutS2